MRTIAVANHKGGVGKTTSTANTAAALGEKGAHVLAVDLDAQAHLGAMFGAQPYGRPLLEDVLLRKAAAAEAVVSVGDHVDVLPCSEALAEALFAIAPEPDGAQRLGEVLAQLPGYQYVLLDSPPGINFWSGMALMTADWAVIPILPEDLAVWSAGKIADFIDQHSQAANPDLKILGAVVMQAKPPWWRLMRESSSRLQADGLRELARVPRAENAARTIRHGRPTFWLHPDGAIATAYRKLAETIERETSGGQP